MLTARKSLKRWLRGVDLNHRPLGYEPNELPDCSTPRNDDNNRQQGRQTRSAERIRGTHEKLQFKRLHGTREYVH